MECSTNQAEGADSIPLDKSFASKKIEKWPGWLPIVLTEKFTIRGLRVPGAEKNVHLFPSKSNL